jgi:hypothetical protein
MLGQESCKLTVGVDRSPVSLLLVWGLGASILLGLVV